MPDGVPPPSSVSTLPGHPEGLAVPAYKDARITNALTVDVEDYFQVSAFDAQVRRDDWHLFEGRVSANTERLLQLFADNGVRATFFVLGWIAERYPALVRRIAACGHELASHGFAHRLVYSTTRAEFAEDLRRATGAIGAATGVMVTGYRAPSYSITRESFWALDELLMQGFIYDASIFPIYHDRYGVPDSPRHPYCIRRPGGSIWEFPGSTVRVAGQNLPIAGGGYFRLLPYGWTRRGIRHVNQTERRPVTFYLHPWEIDPDQPRLNGPLVSKFRHYRNLAKTEDRLKRLLSEFRFDTVMSVLATEAVLDGAALAQPARFDFYPAGAEIEV
jgi:polysaccharide deacetylase family protein (PEP-CTERM system associated)